MRLGHDGAIAADATHGAPTCADRARAQPSTLRLATMFVVLFALSQVPLYAIRYVDITDFPNHLARFYILQHLSDSAWLQRYYAETPHTIFPNLGMEVVVPLLAQCVDTALALKIFASLGALFTTTGAMALARAFLGRVSYMTLGVALFSNNAMFQFGLFNYLFALGLALWLLAAWLMMPVFRRSTLGVIAFAAGATLVYVCHLSAWAVYALATVALQVRFAPARGRILRLEFDEALATVLPLLPALAMHAWLSDPPAGASITESYTSPLALLAYKVALFALAPGAAFSGYAAEGAVLGMTVATAVYIGLRQGALHLSPAAGRIAAVLAVSMALVPPAIFGSALADSRLLVPLALVLWSGLEVRREAWHGRIPAVLMSLAIAASAATGYEWHRREGEYRGIRRALAQLPVGASVATVTLNGGNTYISPHVVAWAVLDRSVLMSNLYTRPFQPVWLRYRPPYAPLAARARTQNVVWEPPKPFGALKGYFDYVVIVGSRSDRAAYGAPARVLYESAAIEIVDGR